MARHAPRLVLRPPANATPADRTLLAMPPADHHVTLLTRAGCHLCDDAREVVAALASRLGTPWDEVDVDSDDELRAEYGDLVPVVLVDGVEHGYLRLDEQALRAALLA